MKVKIIYGTLSGTTQYVAEAIQKKLAISGHQVDLYSTRTEKENPMLDGYEVILFGAPTYEDGRLESRTQEFIEKYVVDLSKFKVGVFGLGSSMYSHFCSSAKILEEWVTKNKGQLIIPALKIDGFPDDLTAIEQWAEQVAKA
jgi:flavodoxin I